MSAAGCGAVPFVVALPADAATVFEGNRAPDGGGGGVYWEDAAPDGLDAALGGNAALYGSEAATPARYLSPVPGDNRTLYVGASDSDAWASGIAVEPLEPTASGPRPRTPSSPSSTTWPRPRRRP